MILGYPRVREKLTSWSSQIRDVHEWRNILAKFALLFFGIALWHVGTSFYAYYLISIAWILDGGLCRFRQTLNEPLVGAILILCIVFAIGILWSEYPKLGFKVWRRYIAFLVFIPYLSLLNKERLPWAIGGLLIGYFGVVAIGIYQWKIVGVPGIPPLNMPHLFFSSMIGIGVIVACYLAAISKTQKVRFLLCLLAISLLFIQFNQMSRGILATTLICLAFMGLLLYKREIKRFLVTMAALTIVAGIFAYSSSTFHERVLQAKSDISQSKAGNYSTSLGYRLAVWDVGLHGIAEHPFFGHGTGMAANYFDKTRDTYKDGLYSELSEFIPATYHYHNDWIEIGMHLGAFGLITYAFLLWSWFRTLRAHQLGIFGATLIFFVFLSGLSDNFIIFRQSLFLLLAITAIAISWQKLRGQVFRQTKNYRRYV
jgi:O-antigen ligase